MGIGAGQLPGAEKRRPVDAAHQLVQVVARERLEAEEGGPGRNGRRPVDPVPGLAGVRDSQLAGLLFAAGVAYADRLVLGADGGQEIIPQGVAHQFAGDADGARGVDHVYCRAAVVGRDLDRRVGLGRGRAADQQRDFQALPRHLVGHRRHFLERRRD